MLNKGINSGKEHRKPYRKSKSWDRSCRNHGSCSWCSRNRSIQILRIQNFADDQLKEYQKASAISNNNRSHRMTRNEKEDRYWKWFYAWASE